VKAAEFKGDEHRAQTKAGRAVLESPSHLAGKNRNRWMRLGFTRAGYDYLKIPGGVFDKGGKEWFGQMTAK